MNITDLQFDQVLNLKIGESIFFKAENARHQKEMMKDFEKLLRTHFLINPTLISQLKVIKSFRKNDDKTKPGLLLVGVQRTDESTLNAVKRNVKGEFEIIENDPLRSRRICLMVADGVTLEEARDLFDPPLSSEEEKMFRY